MPLDAPGAECHAIRGPVAFCHVLPRELPLAIDMAAFARAELGACRSEGGTPPAREPPQTLQIGPRLGAPADFGAGNAARISSIIVLAGEVSDDVTGQWQPSYHALA